MIENNAIGVDAAWLWAGVDAFLVDACTIRRTLRTNNTLGTTSRWTSDILGATGTDRLTVNYAALTVGAAR